jgi:hypothetical protein
VREAVSDDRPYRDQALDRTQPILPLRPGLPARRTHDYERHGTTTLFAALDVLEGTIIADCQPRHRYQEFPSFLERIDTAVAARLNVYMVLDTMELTIIRQYGSGWQTGRDTTRTLRPQVRPG